MSMFLTTASGTSCRKAASTASAARKCPAPTDADMIRIRGMFREESINPKSESRNPKQIRKSKKENSKHERCFGHWEFGFRICFGFRISIFEFIFAMVDLQKRFCNSGPGRYT